jgi:hypothetical protein
VNRSDPPQVRYLYVVGSIFSGSTLLAFVLNTHPEIVSIGEPYNAPRHFKGYRCSCGELLLDCPFFTALQSRVRALGSPFDLTDWRPMLFHTSRYPFLNSVVTRTFPNDFLERTKRRLLDAWPGYAAATARNGQQVWHLASAALEITGKRVFADTQKSAGRISFLRAIPQLDLKVIHLVRDARGGAASLMKHLSIGAVPAAYRWRITNMNAERARRLVPPDRWMRVKYEDLCADPQRVVDAIADFAGVGRAILPRNIFAGEHHIMGNDMRLARGDQAIRRDDSWRTRLTPLELSRIARIAGRANRAFGYGWPDADDLWSRA